MPAHPFQSCQHFVERHQRLFVLTGAGCSTDSGIPDYRDAEGQWKRSTRPVTLQAFLNEEVTRRRYWARSLVGWRHLRAVQPNATHHALARLQQDGRVERLITQNVDGLHQAAGSTQVIDLHGRLDRVRCLGCERRVPRDAVQEALLRLNPHWQASTGQLAPDGDADLGEAQLQDFVVAGCGVCGGLLKPDVVFFGEGVPPADVEQAWRSLDRADAVLVVGSSLMLYSGYRFVREAWRQGKPIAAVNLGRTRADEMLSIKFTEPCGRALSFLLERPQAA